MYLFQKVEELSAHYNDARKNIGEFLLEKRADAADYTMQEIADETFTSKATLTRFAKGCGYSGWVVFMEDFLKEAKYIEEHFSDVDPNMPFQKGDNLSEIAKKIMNLQQEALQETVRLMDLRMYSEAANMIIKAKRTVIFGMKPNSIVAELFRQKLENIGILIYITETDHAGTVAAALDENDFGIIISYSGNNPEREPMRHVQVLLENKVRLAAITSEGDNYLRQNIPCCLTIPSRERLFTKIAGFSTEESLNYIFNVLFAYIFSQNYDRNYRRKIDNSRKLEYRRQTNTPTMKE